MNKNFVHIDITNFVDIVEKASETYSTTEKKQIDIIIDKALFFECVEKIQFYLETISDEPSEYKIAGALTFWIRKLKPLSFELSNNQNNPDIYLNEKIAVIYGYNYIKAVKLQKNSKFIKLSPKFFNDLAVQLRYSSFSPSSIAFLFEAMSLK